MTQLLALWKCLPAPLREALHRIVQATSRAVMPIWLVLQWKRGVTVRAGGSVAVQGFFRSSIGIAQGARLFADALETSGVPVERIDATGWARLAPDLPSPSAIKPSGPSRRLVVSHLNPIELERVIEVSWARAQRRRRHVGYWAWELPVAPEAWRSAFRFVDEVWAPSTFVAGSLRAIAPSSTPVFVVPHPVWATPVAAPDRPGFGLPERACVILVALDLRSTGARKNPLGALEAYQIATASRESEVSLICKISGGDIEPELFASVRERCDADPSIVMIDEVLSEARMSALVASADIVFSPHRAEGFGLLLAEGMRLGKAVVATGWSGNMDFMDERCAALIDFTLTPVFDPQGLYGSAEWAEPDLAHAARLLQGLISDPAARAELGEQARRWGGPVFDPGAWRELISLRLRE